MQRLYQNPNYSFFTKKSRKLYGKNFQKMSDKFKDKYRSQSARAAWWNYCNQGLYFVTICTHGMDCCLGEIAKNEMQLSTIGQIAEKCWNEIPIHFPFVKLHAMVVMPNHIHGILEILPDEMAVQTLHATSVQLHATSLQTPIPPAKNEKMAAISPKKGSLASIVRSYKSAVSKQAHFIKPQFYWQERYYDNIIRDLPAAQSIKAYISKNVSSWNEDRFFK
jgi:putative transposase